MGRPISTSYSDEEKAEVAAHVIVNVACGRFVSRIFREDEITSEGVKLPAAGTFWRWILEDETGELDEKLVRARERGVEALMDETLDIADETEFDTIKDAAGSERPNSEWISRSRLRIETRMKLAQMLKPKTYGPKLDLTSGGEKIEPDEITRATRLAAIFSELDKRNAPDQSS